MVQPRHPLALRIPADKLEAIDARANAVGMSRTDYMVRAALGEITDPQSADAQFAKIFSRLERLERLVELGGGS